MKRKGKWKGSQWLAGIVPFVPFGPLWDVESYTVAQGRRLFIHSFIHSFIKSMIGRKDQAGLVKSGKIKETTYIVY